MSAARILVIDDSPTILKVVAAILSRHGYEATTARDGLSGLEAIARSRPDLVLLDFVMPKMNGYQFCRELRSGEHRTLPVVLMSAKGDKIRGQFVLQTGAVDAITKPFDARALVAVVEGALAKANEGRARQVPIGHTMPDEDTIAESVRPGALKSGKDSQRAAIQLAQQIASAVVPAVLALDRKDRDTEAALVAAVARAVTPELLAQIGGTLKEAEVGGESKEVLAGEIAAIPLAEVLQVLQLQRQTGVLRVSNGKATVALYMRQGNLDLVQSQGASDEFRLGRYFLERGVLTREQLDQAVSSRKPGRLLGEALVEAGAVKREELQLALERQSSELVYEMLRWAYGRFSLSREPFPDAVEAAKLGLNVGGLILEGFRRVDEWRLMEGTIQFEQVPVIDQVMLDQVTAQLTRQDELVLRAVDGRRTVSQIIAETHLGSFDALKVVYQFLKSRVIRVRSTTFA